MPTYRSVIIPEIRSEVTSRDAYGHEQRQCEVVGEFKIKIRPSGLIRRRLTIFGREISQYWFGSVGKFKLVIEREGTDKPFHFRLQQTMPTSRIICLESNITKDKYEKEFQIRFFDGSGQYRFLIEIYSQLEWEESKEDIIFLRVLCFDNMIVGLITVVASGTVGYLIGHYI